MRILSKKLPSVKQMKHMETLSTGGAFRIAKNISIITGVPALFLALVFGVIVWILRYL